MSIMNVLKTHIYCKNNTATEGHTATSVKWLLLGGKTRMKRRGASIILEIFIPINTNNMKQKQMLIFHKSEW